MSGLIKNIFVVLAVLQLSILLHAQSHEYSFEKLSIEEGLSQSSVYSVFQDSKGFLWAGTANGLNKYDGYEFTVFKHDPEDSNSISSDMIYCITEDKYGNLWIGTENDLNKYDPVNNKFTRCLSITDSHDLPNSKTIMSVAADKNGIIWMGTQGGGLASYNPYKNKVKWYKSNPGGDNNGYGFVRCVRIDNCGKVWLATQGGLSRYTPETGKFTNYRESFLKQNPSLKKEVYALIQGKDGCIWFTDDSGLNRYDESKDELRSYPFPGGELYRTWVLSEDSKGSIWLGTSYGLLVFNMKTHNFDVIKSDPAKLHAISDNTILTILEDRGGVIWIGTLAGGLNKYTGNKNKFRHFKHIPDDKNSITPGLIYAIHEDRAGNLWVGTTDGLNKIDRNGKVTRYTSTRNDKKTLSYNRVTGIGEDKNGDLWITTQFGFNRYNRKTNDFTRIPVDTSKKNILVANSLAHIYIDDTGIIWIGTFNYGLLKYNPSENKFTRYCYEEGNRNSITSNYINCITEDNNGNLLLATGHGLNIFDKNSGKVTEVYKSGKKYSSLNVDQVLYVYSDEDGIIWLGTYGGGLNKLDRKNKTVQYYSEKEGLPNNVVYGMLPDETGNLWLSTNKGLVRFKKSTGKMRVYDPSDGLQSYEFNSNAFYKSRNGEMYFGGVNGYNSFFPARVQDNTAVPPVVITTVKSLNKEVIQEVIKNTNNPVVIPFSENILTFEFVALDYANPKRNKYLYKLEGFDKEWTRAGGRRYAAYTNLPPGKYTFRVKGSNSDEIWNEEGASFTFVITPPFYMTWWFYLVSVILITGIGLSVHRYRVKMKIKQIVEMEAMRKKIADDFHDELGHRLTKISLYSELMKQELSSAVTGEAVPEADNEDYLKKINEAANSLFDDTKDFIWSIDPVKDTLYDLAVYLKDFGDEFFDRTGIAFRVNEISTELSQINLPMDWKRQLIPVFKEAMNNCLRHSECKNAGLSVTADEDIINIVLRDDGKGFVPDGSSKGRGLENMRKRVNKTGGVLTVESSPGKGTTIMFTGDRRSLNDKQKYKR